MRDTIPSAATVRPNWFRFRPCIGRPHGMRSRIGIRAFFPILSSEEKGTDFIVRHLQLSSVPPCSVRISGEHHRGKRQERSDTLGVPGEHIVKLAFRRRSVRPWSLAYVASHVRPLVRCVTILLVGTLATKLYEKKRESSSLRSSPGRRHNVSRSKCRANCEKSLLG